MDTPSAGSGVRTADDAGAGHDVLPQLDLDDGTSRQVACVIRSTVMLLKGRKQSESVALDIALCTHRQALFVRAALSAKILRLFAGERCCIAE